VQLLLLF